MLKLLKNLIFYWKKVTKTIKNETKKQKGGFLWMLLETLGASLLGNKLTGKGVGRAGYENKKGTGIVRAGYGNNMGFQCRLIF